MTDTAASEHPARLSPIDDLIDVLTLAELGTAYLAVTGIEGQDAASSIGATSARVFEGRSQRTPHGRVFGGQVLAQCVMAAGLTVAAELLGGARPIHSLHGYFMRPGDDSLPIRFAVEEMRDGSSFSTRRVHAVQKQAPIMSMTCSFQTHAGGLDHQDSMPDVPQPETLRPQAELFMESGDPRAIALAQSRPIDLRSVEGSLWLRYDAADSSETPSTEQHVWMRTVAPLPDDPLLHAAVLAYSSDYSLLEPVLRRHRLIWPDPRLRIASLDHSMWFHRAVRADDWVLYAQRSPSATSGRGLGIGEMFSRDGALVATTAQEGMVRVKPS